MSEKGYVTAGDKCSKPGCENRRELYSNECAEHRNPRQPRIETERCSAKLRVPTANGKSEVVFQCMTRIDPGSDHGKHGPHVEHGYVLMADGTHRKYRIEWTDEGPATFRQRPSQARVRKVKQDADA